MPASKETLSDLHDLVAKTFKNALENPSPDEPVSPALLAAASRFLRDNDISVLTTGSSEEGSKVLEKLKTAYDTAFPFLADGTPDESAGPN